MKYTAKSIDGAIRFVEHLRHINLNVEQDIYLLNSGSVQDEDKKKAAQDSLERIETNYKLVLERIDFQYKDVKYMQTWKEVTKKQLGELAELSKQYLLDCKD